MAEYDTKQAGDFFRTNALVGIPEETTALALARRCQKEAEWNTALALWKKGSGYRKIGTSLADPSILVQIGQYFQKPAYLWLPADIEAYTGTLAAWFGCISNNFNLVGNINLYNFNAARGVRLVAP